VRRLIYTRHVGFWALALALGLVTGCGSPEKGGPGFQQSGHIRGGSTFESARYSVFKPTLRAVVDQGVTYLQWQFSLKTKGPTQLQSVRLEEITGPTPLLLVNDQAPELNAGTWTGMSGEIDPRSATTSWLFSPGDSAQTFRFVITGLDGQTDTLEQTTVFSHSAKAAIRRQYGIQ
jgi:hypothetical protein